MSTPPNPFHQWLGLDPRLTAPHHFQLLGVSPKLTDQQEIAKAVEAGVQRNLKLLAKVPAGENDELLAKIKKRLAIARKVLLDPKLREQYLAKLKTDLKNAQAQQSQTKQAQAKQAQLPTTPKPRSRFKKAPETAAKAVQPPLPDLPPTIAGADAAPDPPASASPDSAIPIAIPLAQPVAIEGGPKVPIAQPAVPAVAEPGINISVTRVKRKRNRWLAPLLTVGFLGVVGGGGLYVYQNWESLLVAGGVDPNAPVIPDRVKAVVNENSNPGVDEASNQSIGDKESPVVSTLPQIDLDSLAEVDEDKIMTDPATLASTGRNVSSQNAISSAVNSGSESASNNTSPDIAMDNADDLDDTRGPDMSPPEFGMLEMDAAARAKLARRIKRARRSMLRRDFPTAAVAIRSAESVVADVLTAGPADSRLDEESQSLANLIPQAKEILTLNQGFWKQVIESAKTIPGGQEITVGEQVVGFVESAEDTFIVKKAGSLITYPYTNCPPGLAVAIAEQGAVPDVPTWSKQLASFYAIHQTKQQEHADKIEELLEIADEAGHDCDGLLSFAEFDFDSFGLPSEKIAEVSDEPDPALTTFREENGYSRISKLSTDEAERLAAVLLEIDSPNFEQHAAMLREAIELAVQAENAWMAEDAILELSHYQEVDQAALMLDALGAIGKASPEGLKFRKLAECALAFLNSPAADGTDSKKRQQLVRRLQRLAKSRELSDVEIRLTQVAE